MTFTKCIMHLNTVCTFQANMSAWKNLFDNSLKRCTATSLSGKLLVVGGYDDHVHPSPKIHISFPSPTPGHSQPQAILPSPCVTKAYKYYPQKEPEHGISVSCKFPSILSSFPYLGCESKIQLTEHVL